MYSKKNMFLLQQPNKKTILQMKEAFCNPVNAFLYTSHGIFIVMEA